MRIVLDGVSKGRGGAALPTTSLDYASGIATLVLTETQQRPTVLGLLASGRMRPDAGTITIDGRTDPGAIRAAVALVDAPIVSEPASAVSLFGVVAEELMFAGRPSGGRAVLAYLDSVGLREHSRTSMADLDPDLRIRALVDLALLRDGVEGIVLTSPDRHGGDPEHWWGIAQELAGRGIAVLVIAGIAASRAISARQVLVARGIEVGHLAVEPHDGQSTLAATTDEGTGAHA